MPELETFLFQTEGVLELPDIAPEPMRFSVEKTTAEPGQDIDQATPQTTAWHYTLESSGLFGQWVASLASLGGSEPGLVPEALSRLSLETLHWTLAGTWSEHETQTAFTARLDESALVLETKDDLTQFEQLDHVNLTLGIENFEAGWLTTASGTRPPGFPGAARTRPPGDTGNTGNTGDTGVPWNAGGGGGLFYRERRLDSTSFTTDTRPFRGAI